MEKDYNKAMTTFLDVVTKNTNSHYKNNLPSLTPPTYTKGGGSKYDKINADTAIYCFVEKTTGNIYKPASWRAPFTKGKNPVRGSIYNTKTYEHADPYGSWLYHKY